MGARWTAVAAMIAVGACRHPAPPPEPVVEGPPAPPPVCAPSAHELRPTGPLAGVTAYLSAGHGRMLQAGIWDFQRDAFFGSREDLWTARFVIDHLAPTLEAAGAKVVTLRERDLHVEQVIVDDADPSFVADTGGVPGADLDAWAGGDQVLPAGALARWTLTAPADGRFVVYARWTSAPDRAHEARYTLTRSGGSDARLVDQRVHGTAWWPLGEVDLRAGEPLEICLDADVGTLSADAIRVGGGMASPGPGWAEAPAWEVAPIHRRPMLGGPESLAWLDDGQAISDIRYRARWASWAAGEDPGAVYVSVHTDSDHGAGRGTTVFAGVESSPRMRSTPASSLLSREVRDRVAAAIGTVDPRWLVRPVQPGDFSEISPKWSRLPSFLIEVGFHDHRRDAERLADPAFRTLVAEAMRDGLAAWWGQSRPDSALVLEAPVGGGAGSN